MGILYDLYLARQKLDIVSRGQTLDGKIRVWRNAIICRLCIQSQNTPDVT